MVNREITMENSLMGMKGLSLWARHYAYDSGQFLFCAGYLPFGGCEKMAIFPWATRALSCFLRPRSGGTSRASKAFSSRAKGAEP